MRNKKFLRSKKAFFFTLTVIFLITLLLLISYSYRRDYSKDSIKTRLLAGNNFIDSVENDAKRAIYISGQRTVLAILDRVTTKGYIEDSVNFSDVFADAFINGSLEYSLNYSEASKLLENATLADWESETVIRSSLAGFNLTFSNFGNADVVVGQSTPWAIDMNVTFDYILRDVQINATWNRHVVILGKISILGLEDPLYSRQLGKDITNTIHRTPYTGFVTGSCDATNLTGHIDVQGVANQTGSYYFASVNSSNYLNKLRGNYSAHDAAGIESIINAANLDQQIANSSLVDHSYFEGIATDLVGVSGTYSWLKMTRCEANQTYQIPGNCLI